MTSFEKFHPVLTAHYTLDWLTQTPVKQIDDLFSQPVVTTVKAEQLPTAILETVKRVNRVMQKVMNGTELTWGITDSRSQIFIGIVTISGFQNNSGIGNLDFIVTQAATNTIGEVVERARQFVSDHFDFERLQIQLTKQNNQVINSLISKGFSQSAPLTFIIKL
jgi:hypothetical protein